MIIWVNLICDDDFSLWVPWEANTPAQARTQVIAHYSKEFPWYTYQVVVTKDEAPWGVKERIERGLIYA